MMDMETVQAIALAKPADMYEDIWHSVEDKLPTENGIYKCKVRVGSMSPKIVEDLRMFRNRATGGRFLAGDWQTVLEWRHLNKSEEW